MGVRVTAKIPNTVTGATNHNTLEYLNTRAGAFHDVHVNFDAVARTEVWDVTAEACCIDEI
jgi:hypothetical protein